MKKDRIKKIIIIIIILILTTAFKTTKEEPTISEEAIPIRHNEEIIGLNYNITIPNDLIDNKVIINTKIIDSINHYTDIKSIDNFQINIIISNKSNYIYKVTDIQLSSNNKNIQKIKYHNSNNKISFKLVKDKLINNYEKYHINIELKKNTKNKQNNVYYFLK